MLEPAVVTADWPLIELPILTELPTEDNIPMETPYHRAQMNLLIELTNYHWRGRDDFYTGGNMFVYYSSQQVRNREYRGPDFFIVKDVDGRRPRDAWIVWEEAGRYPDLIVELLSVSTAQEDTITKKHIYERTFQTTEYFCYDPISLELIGWRLRAGKGYQRITPNAKGQLWSNVLQLWLGVHESSYLEIHRIWLRFFDKSGQLVPLFGEAATQRAEAEAQRAEAEAQRAEAEAQRADHAEAEVAKLQAELAKLRGGA